MRQLHLSLEDPALNLAVDEALLMAAESQTNSSGKPHFGDGEVLRFWRFCSPVVVIGRGSKATEEANLDFCQRAGIPVLRRCSGGAAILAGPDCWMYSVVLDMRRRPELRSVDAAHHLVMSRLAMATQRQFPGVVLQGICDLTLNDRKFSGNSLRVARDHLLYHGTILQDVEPELLESCLGTPPRQPEYRHRRTHADFVTALNLDTDRLQQDLAELYGAQEHLTLWPESLAQQLATEKYASDAWTLRH